MSKLEVNKIDPQSGTDLELGTSGDTITIPTGVTLDASNATTTLPANVVTTDGSQTLTNKNIDASQLTGTITPSDNTVSLAKLTATGTKDATTFLRGDNTFGVPPLGGITEADQWRISSNFSGSTGTINAAWERNDTLYDKIGTGMSESSGIFTFPSTGIWRVAFSASMIPNGSSDYSGFKMEGSQNSGTNYYSLTEAWSWSDTSNRTLSASGEAIFDVNNASNCRFRFFVSATTTVVFQGSTSANTTYATFIRLGDT